MNDEVVFEPAPDDVVETPLSERVKTEEISTLEIEMTANGERRLRSKDERYLRSLNQAIAQHPEASTNYVLRGELALQTRDYDHAVADFERAIELASVQVTTEKWGFIAQTMQDRADAGLKKAWRQVRKRK